MKNKMNQQENIREISRERMIEQIQLIRGGLKNNKNGIIENQKTKNAIVIEIDITVSLNLSRCFAVLLITSAASRASSGT